MLWAEDNSILSSLCIFEHWMEKMLSQQKVWMKRCWYIEVVSLLVKDYSYSLHKTCICWINASHETSKDLGLSPMEMPTIAHRPTQRFLGHMIKVFVFVWQNLFILVEIKGCLHLKTIYYKFVRGGTSEVVLH